MRPEETLDFQLRRTWTSLIRFYNFVASERGATVSMGMALLAISPNGTPSTQIGPKMGIEPNSISRLLNSLELQGLIERRTSSKDKRITLISLTAKGKKKRDEIRDVVIKFNTEISDKIGEANIAQCLSTLSEINSFIETKIE